MIRSSVALAIYSSTSPTPPGTPLSSLVQNDRTVLSAALTGFEDGSRRSSEVSDIARCRNASPSDMMSTWRYEDRSVGEEDAGSRALSMANFNWNARLVYDRE